MKTSGNESANKVESEMVSPN